MENTGCFLKFSKRCHLESLKEGHIYFTTAKRMREMENERKERGIGDTLEGGIVVASQPMRYEDCTGIQKVVDAIIKIQFEPLDEIPVFCVLACNKEDCIISTDGKLMLKLPDEVKQWFDEHFSEYDAVAIIREPNIFANDIENVFGGGCIHKRIIYTNRDARQIRENESHPLNSLLRTASHRDPNKPNTWYATADDSVEQLFEKDVLFKNEREYRFILKNEEIKEPKVFKVPMNSQIEIISTQELWEERIVPET